MLARRRRPLHHAAAGFYAEPGHRQAQLRHVPHAGVRRAHHRHALADAQAGRRALPPHASSTAHQRMEVAVAIGGDPATMYSAMLPLPPDLDEMLFAGFLRRKPVEMVQCETVGPGSAGQRRDRAGRLRRTGRAAHRRAVRRSHRLLLAGRRVPGVPRHLRHPAQGPDLRRPPSWARRPWRTTTWARPSSASSCR